MRGQAPRQWKLHHWTAGLNPGAVAKERARQHNARQALRTEIKESGIVAADAEFKRRGGWLL